MMLKTTIALAAFGLASAGAVSAAPRAAAPRTFTVLSVQKQFTTVPQISKTSPPRIGDRMIFNDVDYNRVAQFGKPAGARIGTTDNLCTIVSMSELQCTLVAHVPTGALVATGSVNVNSHVTNFAITGGVGSFAGAHGSATGRDLDQTKTVVVIRLDS